MILRGLTVALGITAATFGAGLGVLIGSWPGILLAVLCVAAALALGYLMASLAEPEPDFLEASERQRAYVVGRVGLEEEP